MVWVRADGSPQNEDPPLLGTGQGTLPLPEAGTSPPGGLCVLTFHERPDHVPLHTAALAPHRGGVFGLKPWKSTPDGAPPTPHP